MVGGVTPGKGGIVHEGIPVFNTVTEAMRKTDANAAMVFVELKPRGKRGISTEKNKELSQQELIEVVRDYLNKHHKIKF